MSEILWEREFARAMESAGKTGKPIFQDFWAEG